MLLDSDAVLQKSRTGTLIGSDQFGNQYYEQIEGCQHFRHRWVVYGDLQNYNATSVPPEWHGWLHHVTDDEPVTVRSCWSPQFSHFQKRFTFLNWNYSCIQNRFPWASFWCTMQRLLAKKIEFLIHNLAINIHLWIDFLRKAILCCRAIHHPHWNDG